MSNQSSLFGDEFKPRCAQCGKHFDIPGCGTKDHPEPDPEPEASIARAAEGNEEWVGTLLAVIQRYAKGFEFSTDRLWWEVKNLDPPRDGRAMGAVMRQAKLSGLVEETGEYTKSIRPECHRRPIPSWRRI
jgi:hypothetical protein